MISASGLEVLHIAGLLVWAGDAKKKLWWYFKGEHQKKAFVVVSFSGGGGACLALIAREDYGNLQLQCMTPPPPVRRRWR
jgi:hypothetical protein